MGADRAKAWSTHLAVLLMSLFALPSIRFYLHLSVSKKPLIFCFVS
jgi:hypothetical protein